MNKLKEIKNKHNLELSNLVESLKVKFLDTKEGKGYAQKIVSFIDNPYSENNLWFDDSGLLCASTYISSPDIDLEILESVWDDLCVFSVIKDTVSICLGDAIIFNEHPERGHYAIYSRELGLKVSEVSSLEEGLDIIEQAMNKHGYFPAIVSCDRYGNVSLIK